MAEVRFGRWILSSLGKTPSFSLVVFLVLKSTLSDITIAAPSPLINICVICPFPSFYFQATHVDIFGVSFL